MTDLVLLPGMLCDRALWENQIAALGFGTGGARAQITVGDLTRADSIAGMASDALLASPERFALAAMSMGGFVAFEIMRQAPERVLRLALIDTSARADTPEQAEGRRSMMRQARVGAFKGMTVRQLPRWVHPAHMANADLVAAVTAMTVRVGRDAFMRQQQAALDRRDSRPDLPRIACPTLVLCGREDQATPLALHEEIAAAIPSARLVVVEECGHLSPLEQPAAVNAAMVEWLGWGEDRADRD